MHYVFEVVVWNGFTLIKNLKLFCFVYKGVGGEIEEKCECTQHVPDNSETWHAFVTIQYNNNSSFKRQLAMLPTSTQ